MSRLQSGMDYFDHLREGHSEVVIEGVVALCGGKNKHIFNVQTTLL
jgi:hypothetical protein